MVSTTLTTIAAGKTTSGINNLHSSATNSSTSPENFATIETTNRAHYQPRSNSSSSSSAQQQHVSSSLASPAATVATRNSFYYNLTHERKTTAINGNDNHHDSSEFNHNVKYYQREQIQQQQQLVKEQQHQKCFNGPTTNGETTKPETASTPTKTATPATPAVNLSQALLSTSPPIKDQISLLFPKCRPKTTNNNFSLESLPPTDGNSNAERGDHAISSNSNSKLNYKQQTVIGIESEDNHHHTQQRQTQQQQTQSTNNHYYRSVNIITQSPPPHSASSISSESLSSVTPRISTNPFLCSSLSAAVDTNEITKRKDFENLKSHQQTADEKRKVLEQDGVDEDLPVFNYAPFYYHTSTTSPPSKDLHKHKDNFRELHTNSRELCDRTIDEMPRKRSQYERYHHIQAINGQNYGREEKPYNLNHAEILSAVQQHQQAQQNGHQTANQNPFVKDNYWESRQNTTPTTTVLNSPDYSSNNGSMEMENRTHNRRTLYQQQSEQHLEPQQQYQQPQPPFIGRQQPPVSSHHIRLGRSPNNDAAYQEPTTTSTSSMTQKRNSYNAQQQHTFQKSNTYSEGLTPLAAQYLYGSKTSLQESSSQNHQNDWPEKRDFNHDRSERCLTRERDRERELREQRSKTNNAERERYISAALVRESVGEQTAIEVRDRRDRDRHAYTSQQHHHLPQKYHQQLKSGHYQQQHPQKSYKQQQQQQQQNQTCQRQLNDERLNSNNDVIFDDMTESWQSKCTHFPFTVSEKIKIEGSSASGIPFRHT